MGKIVAVCISDKRGERKSRVKKAEFKENYGLIGDAHGGPGQRQVSFLAIEDIQKMKEQGLSEEYGCFGENIVTEGISPQDCCVGKIFKIGQALLRISQIGKECHAPCEIAKKIGTCIMPSQGIFAQVLNGGKIEENDFIEIGS